MVRHFVAELERLKQLLLEQGALVEAAICRSVSAVTSRNAALANEVLRNEAQINRLEIDIDDFAVSLLALQQPMATDLRLIFASVKINNDLERMGDLAVNIAHRALSLVNLPSIGPTAAIPRIAAMVESMVRKSLDSFIRCDSEAAREVLRADDDVDRLRTALAEQLLACMEQDPKNIRPSVDLLFVVTNLERIADHATNVAEDVLFLTSGIDVRHHAEAPG
ncbi:MAG: phosphate signaling complex protein PhoU [Acidobacteriota bacterium]|nr:phosphate signaling complex protein PhoU [Acidobacteriota bacterium]